MKRETGGAGRHSHGGGGALSEELAPQELTSQLPAGLITADGQQPNVMVYTTSSWHMSDVQQMELSRPEQVD